LSQLALSEKHFSPYEAPVWLDARFPPLHHSAPHFKELLMAKPRFSLDLWAVVHSLTLALAVRLGAIKTVPW
jgi:hypothetical protein